MALTAAKPVGDPDHDRFTHLMPLSTSQGDGFGTFRAFERIMGVRIRFFGRRGRFSEDPGPFVEIEAQIAQNLDSDAFSFPYEAQSEVFRPNPVVTEPQSLAKGELEDLFRPRSEGNVAMVWIGSLRGNLQDLFACQFVLGDDWTRPILVWEFFQELKKGEHQVLGPDVAVLHGPSLFLGVDDGLASVVGESFKHEGSL